MTKKFLAFGFHSRYSLDLITCSSFILPTTAPIMRPAGNRGQAQTSPQGGGEERGGQPPRPRPRWGVPEAEAAALEVGPGSPAPQPARPNLRRATGRCGWEKRESKMLYERRLGRCWTRGEGQRPSFYAYLAAVLVCRLLVLSWRRSITAASVLFFGSCRVDGP